MVFVEVANIEPLAQPNSQNGCWLSINSAWQWRLPQQKFSLCGPRFDQRHQRYRSRPKLGGRGQAALATACPVLVNDGL
jgi:hypothetical protein